MIGHSFVEQSRKQGTLKEKNLIQIFVFKKSSNTKDYCESALIIYHFCLNIGM